MEPGDAVGVDFLKAFLDAFNRHDLDGVMDFFADHPILDSPRGPHPWGTRAEGRDEVRRLLASRFEGIPNVRYEDDRHFACGTRGASEWMLTGNARDGTEIRVQGCDLFEFLGGRISRKDSYWKLVEKP